MKFKINDIRLFEQLYGANVPYLKELDYYLEMQMRLGSLNLHDINDFMALEAMYPGPGEAFKHKDEIFNKAIEVLKNSNAYKAVQALDMSTYRGLTTFAKEFPKGKTLTSLDLRSANWTVLKWFDTEYELPPEFAEYLGDKKGSLLHSLGAHNAICASKSFRQAIMGNLNPKRFGQLQLSFMNTVVLPAVEEICGKDSVIRVSNDEIIFLNDDAEKINRIQTRVWMNDMRKNGSLRGKIYKRYPLVEWPENSNPPFTDRENVYVEVSDSPIPVVLKGLPKDLFYVYNKIFILKEPLEERDLYFKNRKRLCQWKPEEWT